MNTTEAERMLTLAYFFRTQVEPKEFSLSRFVRCYVPNQDISALLMRYNCGTAACAIGYCPSIFPDDWEWAGYTPVLKNSDEGRYLDNEQKFFGITFEEAQLCFSAIYRRTPEEEADCLEELVHNYGYEYA